MAFVISTLPNPTALLDFESEPSLLIAIDCWQDQNQSVLHNIYKFCETHPGLESVALATYVSPNGEAILKEEPWYSTAQQCFYAETRWEPLRKIWKDTDFVSVKQMPRYTSPVVASISQLPIEQCMLMWHPMQLIYYLNYVNPHIKTIIMAGFVWDICIKSRTIGWLEIARLIEFNIISDAIKIVTRRNLIGQMPNSDQPLDAPWVDIGYDWIQIDMISFVACMNQINTDR